MIFNIDCKCYCDAIEFGQSMYLFIWIPFTIYFHISMMGNMILDDNEYKIKYFGDDYHTEQRSKWMNVLNILFCNFIWVTPIWAWLKALWVGIAKAELKVRLLDLLVRWIYLFALFWLSFTIRHSLGSKLYCIFCISQWLIVLFEYGVIRFGTFFIVMIIPITFLIWTLKWWKDIIIFKIIIVTILKI